jgi:hypothetical protein
MTVRTLLDMAVGTVDITTIHTHIIMGIMMVEEQNILLG